MNLKSLKFNICIFLSYVIGKPISSVVGAAQASNIVSFDVFDTLVIRTVKKPDEVFHLVGQISNLPLFKYNRAEAGHVAHKRSREEEITLDGIYDVLSENYGAEQAKRLKDLEIATEYDVCQSNPELQRFYNWCLKSGKTVVITSDMYLSAETVASILHNVGYHGWNKLFVSSEYGVTKRSGKLFDIVKQEMGDADILHIGDNLISDYIMAKKSGLRAFLYKR